MSYQPGEIVDITIKGARVEGEYEDGLTVDIAPENRFAMPIDLPWGPDLIVERAAPEMRHGDVWRDNDRDLWLIQVDQCDLDELRAFSAAGCLTPEDLDREYGPLTLVHREADGEVSEP